MKYIKHEEHGILPVLQVTDNHKANGWVEIDIDKELAGKKSAKDAPAKKEDDAPKAKSIKQMTKAELEEYARGFNDKDGNPIELDISMTKKNMIADLDAKLG